MNNNWVKIYSNTENYLVELARTMLADEKIKAVILNKKDSAYGTFGEIELYTAPEDVERAQTILKEGAF